MCVALVSAMSVLAGPAAGMAAAPPKNTLPPEVVLVGKEEPGSRLVCAPGSWSPGGVHFEYEWVRDGIGFASLPGELPGTYTLKATDEHKQIWCIVTAIEGSPGFERTVLESANSFCFNGCGPPLRPPEPEKNPAVSGTPEVGKTLSCSQGTWRNRPQTFTYQWYRNVGSAEKPVHEALKGATESTYTVGRPSAIRTGLAGSYGTLTTEPGNPRVRVPTRTSAK